MTSSVPKQEIFLKTLIDHYHPGGDQEFLRIWEAPESFKHLVEAGAVTASPSDLLIDPRKALETIHYSWIGEAMETIPKELHRPTLASLGSVHKQMLCRQLQIEIDKLPSISPIVQSFLIEKLYRKIEGINDVLPLSFSPEYPLTKLLELDKNLILEMFDLLGLHDLAVKAKLIVDKTTLNHIHKSLTPIRKKLFDIFLQQPDRVQLPEIDLSNWTGEPRILKKILHRRGILRLSSALAGYSKDFMWHFTRRLDTGRGRIVLRYYSEEPTQLVQVLTEQVRYIMNIITQKSQS